MIRSDVFWKEELDSPLLQRNAGYITKETIDVVISRAKSWLDLCNDDIQDIQLPSIIVLKDESHQFDRTDMLRIFKLDAERTFQSDECRRLHIEALCTLYTAVQDYHQGMGFVVAFFLLFLPIDQVVQLVLVLHYNYVSGYFKAAPVAYVRDAKVFDMLLAEAYPTLQKKLSSVPPEAYCSKWFVGFNVHVLTFEAIAKFFDSFFVDRPKGFFHFKFALSLVRSLEDKITSTKDVGKLLAYLRLDQSEFPNQPTSQDGQSQPLFTTIVEDAISIDLSPYNIDDFRQQALEALEKHEREVQQFTGELEEISDYFSDEDGSQESLDADDTTEQNNKQVEDN